MKITVTAFIFHKNRVLFIYHKGKDKWMHPGGHLEEGEDFDEALKREIKEETNLKVKIIDRGPNINLPNPLKKMKRPFFIHKNPMDGKIALDYICKAKEPIDIKIQEEEVSDYKWVERREIENLKTYPTIKELALKAFDFIKQ